ncbi:GGDEF domain-containing protein [Rheinheimera sp. D18]|nr:GGDEF domain-containing protein [Rheinheimera sp. D18]
MANMFSAYIKRARAIFIIALLFCSCLVKASALSELELIDDTKAIDISAFREKLADFSRQHKVLSADELSYFQLLQGYSYILVNDYKAATRQLEDMLMTAQNNDLRFRAKAWLINAYILQYNYQSAFSFLEQINRQVEDISNIRARDHGMSILAYTYNQLEQFDTAKYYAEQLVSDTLSGKTRCHANHHVLAALVGLAQWREFDQRYNAAEAQCLAVDERLVVSLMRLKYLDYLLHDNRAIEAISFFKTIAAEINATAHKQIIANAQLLYAKALFQQKNYPEALTEANKALTLFEGSDDNKVSVATYALLQQLHTINKDYKQALAYQLKFSDAEKTLSDARYKRMQAYYMARTDVDTNNRQMAMLQKDNELTLLQKNAYQQHIQQQRLLALALISVLILISVLLYLAVTGRRRFKRMAEFDQLTGISNRYHFNNQAKVALDYCESNAKPVALMLFELDNFARINQEYGQTTGDWLLQRVVLTCRNFMRNNDVFGRIGDEEFVLVLPGCLTDKAVLLAEICRDAISNITKVDSIPPLSITASFGVTGSDNSGYQLKQLLADADVAMYQAKAAGRNRVVVFSS